jgi:hypothetical protein
MRGVTPAAWTEFLDRKLLGLALLILASGVIAPFASVTLKADQVSHSVILWSTRAGSLLPCGAHDGNRTHDLFLTKEVLYRLSYVGARFAFRLRAGGMERETGLEPATPSLEGSRSTN